MVLLKKLVNDFQRNVSSINKNKTKISFKYSYNPEQLLINVNGGINYIKQIHKYIYDFSIALANQWKSNNKIININFDPNVGINIILDETIYDKLLQCIFIDGDHGQLNPPNSGPWMSEDSNSAQVPISMNSMKNSGLYNDLQFFVPESTGGKIVNLFSLDLDMTNPNNDYYKINKSSKDLLKMRCQELTDKINSSIDNYRIYQRFYVNVIIQAIYDISKIVNISSLISKKPIYLRYANIYRKLFNLPLFSFMEYPTLTEKDRQLLLLTINQSNTNLSQRPAPRKFKRTIRRGGNKKRDYDESKDITFEKINLELMYFINQPINDKIDSIKLIDLLELYLIYDDPNILNTILEKTLIENPVNFPSLNLIEDTIDINMDLSQKSIIETLPEITVYGGKKKKSKKKKSKKKKNKKKKNKKKKKSIKKKKSDREIEENRLIADYVDQLDQYGGNSYRNNKKDCCAKYNKCEIMSKMKQRVIDKITRLYEEKLLEDMDRMKEQDSMENNYIKNYIEDLEQYGGNIGDLPIEIIDKELKKMNCKDRLSYCQINRKSRNHCNSEPTLSEYIKPCRKKSKLNKTKRKAIEVSKRLQKKHNEQRKKEALEEDMKIRKEIEERKEAAERQAMLEREFLDRYYPIRDDVYNDIEFDDTDDDDE